MAITLARGVLLGVFLTACSREDDPAAIAAAPAQAQDARPAAPTGEAAVAVARLERSMALERQGDLEAARIEAEAAVSMGGGRDASLQVAKLAILGQRYDDAAKVLEPLVRADPNDAAAQYDLALVRHHQGDYNRARNGYLATLRIDPRHADARYNLAVLCSAHGFVDEARHHVAKLRAALPDDPRVPELERRVGGTGAAGPAGATAPSGAPPGTTVAPSRAPSPAP
jgi:tetratricopeptide (TPR) repeat protein